MENREKWIAALRKSVAKWQGIVYRGYAIIKCECCIQFSDTCRDCPIGIMTGRGECWGTPYEGNRGWVRHDVGAAEAELQFLEGLLDILERGDPLPTRDLHYCPSCLRTGKWGYGNSVMETELRRRAP